MKLDAIARLAEDKHRALIVGHDYPDPDCLASAWGVKRFLADRFGLEGDITFGGFAGRAGNRALIDLLRIEYVPIHMVEFDHYDFVAMVDTQPGTGNNSYETGRPVDLLIDHHHPRFKELIRGTYIYRECGSTTAVVAELLFKSGMAVDPHLATALFLGIKTDTLALGREFCKTDRQYYLKLFPLADHALLSRIERPDLPADYFRVLHEGLERTSVYGLAAVSHLGTVAFPEAIAEFADLLLQLEGVEWVLCTGTFREEVFFSIRMGNVAGDSSVVARSMVKGLGSAGGHEEMAGGKARTGGTDGEALVNELKKRFLAELRVSPQTGRPLFHASRERAAEQAGTGADERIMRQEEAGSKESGQRR
jgi:nanoRNase/pAp phosphatase (c-di-AMP/oligoRNAs hydrolase)